MSKRNWHFFLEDILESMDLIADYIQGMDYDRFKNDRKTIDAVVRNLEIIGEAARNIPEDVRNNYRDVDWKGIVGLRNRIAHEYFGIDTSIIWNIISVELPPFKKKLQKIQ